MRAVQGKLDCETVSVCDCVSRVAAERASAIACKYNEGRKGGRKRVGRSEVVARSRKEDVLVWLLEITGMDFLGD